MYEARTTYTCHRCGADLPLEPARGESSALFCPHCGAPQLLMPEEMRSDPEPVIAEPTPTTGMLPPPRPREPESIEWRTVLLTAAPVALGSAALTVMGLAFDVAAHLQMLWVLATGSVVLALYHRQRPQAHVDGRVGLRVGLVAGLLTIAAIGVTLAITGVVARFGLHRMAGFDAVAVQMTDTLKTQMLASLKQQNQPADAVAGVLGLAASPEARAGAVLVDGGLLALVILLVTTAGGGFAGLLAVRRQRVKRLL